jgi:hypothetical protein
VAAGEREPLAIGVFYMKFLVDTADVAEIKDLMHALIDTGPKTFLDDWARTGPSIL